MLIKYIYIPTNLWKGIYATGSRVICNPPPTDTDEDYVICTQDWEKLNTFLENHGFNGSCQDEEKYDLESEGFTCYRKGNINLIVTEDYEWYLDWVKATKLAKKLNLLKKEDRIILFKYVLYEEI